MEEIKIIQKILDGMNRTQESNLKIMQKFENRLLQLESEIDFIKSGR